MDRPGTSVGVMPNVMDTGPAGTGPAEPGDPAESGGVTESAAAVGDPGGPVDGEPEAPAETAGGEGGDTCRANWAGLV